MAQFWYYILNQKRFLKLIPFHWTGLNRTQLWHQMTPNQLSQNLDAKSKGAELWYDSRELHLYHIQKKLRHRMTLHCKDSGQNYWINSNCLILMFWLELFKKFLMRMLVNLIGHAWSVVVFYSPCRGTIHPLVQSPDQSQKGNGGAVRLPHTGKRKCWEPRLTSPPVWRDGVKKKGFFFVCLFLLKTWFGLGQYMYNNNYCNIIFFDKIITKVW